MCDSHVWREAAIRMVLVEDAALGLLTGGQRLSFPTMRPDFIPRASFRCECTGGLCRLGYATFRQKFCSHTGIKLR